MVLVAVIQYDDFCMQAVISIIQILQHMIE